MHCTALTRVWLAAVIYYWSIAIAIAAAEGEENPHLYLSLQVVQSAESGRSVPIHSNNKRETVMRNNISPTLSSLSSIISLVTHVMVSISFFLNILFDK